MCVKNILGTRRAASLGASGKAPQHIEERLSTAVSSSASDDTCLAILHYFLPLYRYSCRRLGIAAKD